MGQNEITTDGAGRRCNRRARRIGLAVALATALSAGAGVAQAYTTTPVPCAPRAQSPVLAGWGDTNDYFLLPGGSFDRATDWYLANLTVPKSAAPAGSAVSAAGPAVEANLRVQVPGRVARSRVLPVGWLAASEAPALPVTGYRAGTALRVPTTDVVSSATVCIKPDEPSVRFFYRDPGIAGTTLVATVYQVPHMQVPTVGPRPVNRMSVLRIKPSTGAPAWRLSPVLLTGADHSGGFADVFVTFTVEVTDTLATTRGEWLVDNVYVDPFRSR
jgi:hypothetical protein